MKVVALAGGVGAGKFLRGLVQVVPASDVTVVVNTGDDIVVHGLHVSPDLDSVTYWLAGVADRERGWGREGETFRATEELRAFGAEEAWFGLGDLDLATHLFRTALPGRRFDAVGGDRGRVRTVRRRVPAAADERRPRDHAAGRGGGERHRARPPLPGVLGVAGSTRRGQVDPLRGCRASPARARCAGGGDCGRRGAALSVQPGGLRGPDPGRAGRSGCRSGSTGPGGGRLAESWAARR